ncbi:MAG: Maf family protein [Solirubrobacteraceae bacterium]
MSELVSGGNQLVLASRSPQRRAILEALGVVFEVRAPEFEECESGEAEGVALQNALGKASAVHRAPDELVLGVDTVVSLDERLWGKPADDAEARETLTALSGRTHTVLSAIALLGLEREPRTATCATAVTFRRLDADTIDWYARRGEWRERAGGYAIQGAGCALVAEIAGDWTNVVGLPVATLLAAHPSLLAA